MTTTVVLAIAISLFCVAPLLALAIIFAVVKFGVRAFTLPFRAVASLFNRPTRTVAPAQSGGLTILAIVALVVILSMTLVACGALFLTKSAPTSTAIGQAPVVAAPPANVTVNQTVNVGGTQPESAAAPVQPSLKAPQTNPGLNGVTLCSEAEKFVTGSGTPEDPYVYPANWVHDLCFAGANGGTGAKFIVVNGPTALQMGEATGPARMVFVPAGTTFIGWTQGGWRYVTNEALLAQWKVENESTGRLGLICGYEKALNIGHLPTFKWDGSKESSSPELECSLTKTAIVSATPIVAATEEDWVTYPIIFKGTLNGTYYCGATTALSALPAGFKTIESWTKNADDKNYLHADGQYGMSASNGFCSDDPVSKHNAPVGTVWTTVLIDSTGTVTPVTFPLP